MTLRTAARLVLQRAAAVKAAEGEGLESAKEALKAARKVFHSRWSGESPRVIYLAPSFLTFPTGIRRRIMAHNRPDMLNRRQVEALEGIYRRLGELLRLKEQELVRLLTFPLPVPRLIRVVAGDRR